MTSTTLKPRKVDQPFMQRWLRSSLELVLRSPGRFGLLIALLDSLDCFAVNLASDHHIEKMWVDTLGAFALPFVLILVAAVARGADEKSQTWVALVQVLRKTAWMGALGVGTIVTVLSWSIYSIIYGLGAALLLGKPGLYLQDQGQFLASVEAGILLSSIVVGPCYFPLLVLEPTMSPLHARDLSMRANEINDGFLVIALILMLNLSAIALAAAVPAHGLTMAMCLVLMGVLNYVAYRDIFEGRSGNRLRVTEQIHAVGGSFSNSSNQNCVDSRERRLPEEEF
ncbi:MAG: hypothetical protein ACLQO1_09230 [Steroidobacteraceae bacterium]